MYDLIVKGGTVVDPSQNLHGINDVAIENGKIAKIAPDISADESKRVVEVKGKVVTPGLIDIHTHVYSGVTDNGVDPDIGGVRAGVTTMVDAGFDKTRILVVGSGLAPTGNSLSIPSSFGPAGSMSNSSIGSAPHAIRFAGSLPRRSKQADGDFPPVL